jgi:hypothetical protein
MTTLLDGPIDVHYGFLFLAHPDVIAGEEFGREGQANGLCGAAVPGLLSMTTGLHTGEVPVRIEWHADEPPLDDSWEETVEVPYDAPATDLVLSAFEDFRDVSLPRAGPHRARFSASGMDGGNELDTPDEGEAAPDRYLLQLWPAPPAPDRVVKQTSKIAAYWHGVARDAR